MPVDNVLKLVYWKMNGIQLIGLKRATKVIQTTNVASLWSTITNWTALSELSYRGNVIVTDPVNLISQFCFH